LKILRIGTKLFKHSGTHVIQMNILDALNQKSTVEKPDRHYISVYETTQHYGGPEEGGWWYSRTRFVGYVVCMTLEEAEQKLAEAKELTEQHNRDTQRERNEATAALPDHDSPYNDTEGYIPLGWTEGGKLHTRIENSSELGKLSNMDEPRPHYE
jgi:hypothetical protein